MTETERMAWMVVGAAVLLVVVLICNRLTELEACPVEGCQLRRHGTEHPHGVPVSKDD